MGVVLLTALAGCGNAPPGRYSAAGATAGVTPSAVEVGGLAAVTGPLGSKYSPVFAGAQVYFDMVNAAGGVHGRRIRLIATLDDQTDPSTDVAQARSLVEHYKVFAVVPVATPSFQGGSYLAQQQVPTFGYDINTQWYPAPTMFGQDGSYQDPSAVDVSGPFLAKELGLRRVAILSYSIAQSAQCARGQAKSFRQFGFKVVLVDDSIPIGVTDALLVGDVSRIASGRAQLIVMCMDAPGNTRVSESLKRAGLNHVAQYWLSGYDQASLEAFKSQYEGVYLTTSFVPFQEASVSPGLRTYLAQMRRRGYGQDIGEVSLAGWISAAMFTEGLRRAGRNLTRQRLVAAVNSLTAFTSDDIEPVVNWRIDHTGPGPFNCSAWLQVRGGRFVPVFHQPFVCIPTSARSGDQLVNRNGWSGS
ncbi:MAG: ABC transporter substrate-binding protein [Acidimicrobiales bacterium]